MRQLVYSMQFEGQAVPANEGDFRVGEWLIQPQLNRIVGSEKETHLEPKVMDVLVYLAKHAGEVIPKERIIQGVWTDTFVTDDALKYAIVALRKAFEDDAKDPRVIQTIPRRGYQLMASVSGKLEASSARYRIEEKIGQGAMGEVYLAEDTLLKRKVALKFLRPEMEGDEISRKRLLREAQAAAALDHPFICKIYDTGEREGRTFIAMEYVEGPTLKERLAKGPLPLEEALKTATEIGEAFEKAHEKNMVHRDLKPTSIMLTPEGHIKVVDFGLAKQLSPVEGASQEETLTRLTEEDATAGTLAYMSPEQLRGQEVDTRSDIFSFGVVLYEMLTGVHPFKKAQPMETGNAILNEAPAPLSHYMKGPPVLQYTLRKMLAKEPDRRYQHMDEVRIDLEELISEIAESSTTQAGSDSFAATARDMGAPVVERSWRQMIPWSIAGLLGAALLISLVGPWRATRPAEQTPLRLHVQLPPDQSLDTTRGAAAVLSPDGKRLVYVAGSGQARQLYVRALDQLEATVVSGTEGAQAPFFSPDGQWVGFSAGGKLKKISVSGGAQLTVCDSQDTHGASWGRDDTIIFAPATYTGLWQVPAAGGTPKEITVPDREKGESSHRYPQFLPGGKWVLFSAGIIGSFDEANIIAQSLETGERKVVQRGGYYARYLPTGQLVFVRETTLFAAPFDLERLEVTGSPAPILQGVWSDPYHGEAHFAFSQTGTLIYLPGGLGGPNQLSIVWVDRKGHEEPLAAELRPYRTPRLSPDGWRLVLAVLDPSNRDVWMYDLSRETATRLTFNAANDGFPVWTPDGQRVVFASARDGGGLFWKSADGTGQVERLSTSPNRQIPWSFSPDGKRLVVGELNPETESDIHMLSMEGKPTSKPLLQTPFYESQPAISPDGRWMAYTTRESGQREVYVRPFPKVEEGKWQISSGGGREPVWAPEGRELFYRSLNGQEMMMVRVESEPTFTPGSPDVLFTGRYFYAGGRQYDISPDGQRFLMIKEAEQTDEASARTELIIVQNWFDELKRLVPTSE
ncbi:protein kinase [Acidobacteria bacterium AH-259-G07]|nr:protein kinase [Acidobacteria bacterium AH-259-G07]